MQGSLTASGLPFLHSNNFFYYYYGFNVPFLQNSYFEAHTQRDSSKKWGSGEISQKERPLMNRTGDLVKEAQGSLFASSTMWIYSAKLPSVTARPSPAIKSKNNLIVDYTTF